VDPLRIGDYLREFSALVGRFGYRTSIYGHFGDGCVHARLDFDLKSRAGIAHWRGFLGEAAALVVKYGGSLSGEHGDGQAKAEFLPVMFGPELMQAFREFKAAWDPAGRMNPGKLIDARRADQDLRWGEDSKTITIASTLAFRSEIGDGFGRELERCIGMGKCRAEKGGTMCPSYRATREERYSTRGRARLLSEMLRGEVITDGWSSEPVKDALEWCLACKGCASDCPTHTDMAAYKAEFLSHYYETHLRPRQAHLMGRIGQWAPYASLVRDWRMSPPTGGSASRASRRSGRCRNSRHGLSARVSLPERWASGSCCSMTPSTTISARRPRPPRSACSKRRAARSSCRPRTSAAAAPTMTSACSARRAALSSASWRSSRATRRSWSSSPDASRCSARSSPSFSRATHAPRASPTGREASRNSCRNETSRRRWKAR